MKHLAALLNSGVDLPAVEPDGILYKLTTDVCSSWFPGDPRAECASLAVAYLGDHVVASVAVALIFAIGILAIMVRRNPN